jgi:hypothetical protein
MNIREEIKARPMVLWIRTHFTKPPPCKAKLTVFRRDPAQGDSRRGRGIETPVAVKGQQIVLKKAETHKKMNRKVRTAIALCFIATIVVGVWSCGGNARESGDRAPASVETADSASSVDYDEVYRYQNLDSTAADTSLAPGVSSGPRTGRQPKRR